MIQTSFLVVFLSSDIYGRPMLIQLTIFTMTVHAGFIPIRFIRNWLLHVLGCLFLFSACLNVLFAFVYDNHMGIGWESTVILPFRLRYHHGNFSE